MVVPIFKKGDQLDLPRSPCSGGIQTRVYLILDLFWFNFQPLLIKVILRGLFMVNNYFIISLKMSFLQVGQCWILKVPPPTWWEFIMAFLSFGKLLQDSSMRAYNVLVFLNLLLLKDHGIPLLMITEIPVWMSLLLLLKLEFHVWFLNTKIQTAKIEKLEKSTLSRHLESRSLCCSWEEKIGWSIVAPKLMNYLLTPITSTSIDWTEWDPWCLKHLRWFDRIGCLLFQHRKRPGYTFDWMEK